MYRSAETFCLAEAAVTYARRFAKAGGRGGSSGREAPACIRTSAISTHRPSRRRASRQR
jgi:hypothetical protein